MRRRWRNPLAGEDWRVRRATYLLLAALGLAYGLALALTGDARYLRGAAMASIALFEWVGGGQIRPLVYYHPAYRVEKRAAAVMFIGIAASTTLGIQGPTAVTAAWLALAFVSRIAALEFILFRNRAPGRQLLHTTQGVVPVPTADEADAILDLAASYRRHEYGSAAMREQYDEAAGTDPQTEQARRIRRQLARMREAVAAEIEVEELGG